MGAFADSFPKGTDCAVYLAPTGEAFTILQESGFANLEDAEAAAHRVFDAYASTRKGTLYWRTRPEAVHRNFFQWTFYMRLLITNKEAIKP